MIRTPKPLSTGRKVRYWFEALALKLVARSIQLLPRRVMLGLSHGVGSIAYYLLNRPRKIALANLAIALGATHSPRRRKEIARRSFQNFSRTMFGLFWSARMNPESFRQLVVFEDAVLTQVRALHQTGRGVIYIGLHYGDWEMAGLCAGFVGVPVNIVTDTMRNTRMEQIFADLRSRSGSRVVGQEGAVLKLFRALRRGEGVALLIDQHANQRLGGEWLEFFGLPTFSNVAAAALSLRTSAPVVPFLATPQSDGRVVLEFGEPIAVPPTSDQENDIRTLSQKCLQFCEDRVRAKPELWLWSYKRWKHYPAGQQTRYPFYSSPAPED